MFDEYTSVYQEDAFKLLCSALEDWLKEYYKRSGAENTQFAIGGCYDYQEPGSGNPKGMQEMWLKLTRNLSADFIAKHIPKKRRENITSISNEHGLHKCLEFVNKDVFNNYGYFYDRYDAPNVLLCKQMSFFKI